MKKELFTIKGLKTWSTDDGGGYQFNLYYDNKQFAWVHNDGNGGMIDVRIEDPQKEKEFNAFLLTLPKWELFDKLEHVTAEIFVDELVTDYEIAKKIAKAKKKGTTFKLLTDKNNMFRTLNVLDLEKAKQYLDQNFPNNYILI